MTKDVIKVRVYYQSMRYTEIREFNLVTFQEVLSQLGGVIGLWLGFSVYSIVEMIDKFWLWHQRSRQEEQRRVG